MIKNISNPFSVVWSKLSTFNQPKVNTESELEYQAEDYQASANSQEYLHPYLIDRVEPSVQHIIFSSYIRF